MPHALDTNVLARILVDDGTGQSESAIRLFNENDVFVPDAVLLETEWLLRSRFGMRRAALNALFSGLLSATNVRFRDRPGIATAIDWHRRGMDFADALHLVQAHECASMITFDKKFIKQSKQFEVIPPVRHP